MASTLAVPLVHKAKSIGALNILSRERDQYTERDAAILRQFAAHVAAALVNARLFEQQRHDAEAFETLAEIGREVAAVLDLDELLSRIAQLTRRVVDYRTFGILLLNEPTQRARDEGRRAVRREGRAARRCRSAKGSSATPRSIAKRCSCRTCRRIRATSRSSTTCGPSWRCRCCSRIAASASSISRARSSTRSRSATSRSSRCSRARRRWRSRTRGSTRSCRATEARLEKELRFAKRVQAALLPTQLPKRMKGVDVAASFAPARELGGDFHDFLVPDSNTLIVAVGDVSGKGVPAALYSVFAGELVRGRTFRRRYLPERSSPATVLTSINTILHERQLEEYYCTLCYALFDLKRRTVTLANSGVPYPIRATRRHGATQIELPGVPLGSFLGVTLRRGDAAARDTTTSSCSARTACPRR